MWHCHTGDCGGGDGYELIKRIESLSYPECVMKMAEIFNVDVSGLEMNVIHTKKEKDEWLELVKKKKKEVALMPYIFPDLQELKPIKKLRDFTPGTLKCFHAQYVSSFPIQKEDGSWYQLHNRILIPIFFKQLCVGVALRRTHSTDIQKWSLQGFDTGNVLYNYNGCVAYMTDHPECMEVILVEGCFDVWSFWQQGIYNVVATFGTHVTAKQEELLQGLCVTLVLAYDNDEAGQIIVNKLITQLKCKFGLYVITFDAGQDPGSTTDLVERYKNKIKYTKWT